jgi:RNA polymerase sigma factor (sigma-70 family)
MVPAPHSVSTAVTPDVPPAAPASAPPPTHLQVLTPYAESLIRFKAKQLCSTGGFRASDEDDLIQELTLKLLEKAPRYDPNRGASLKTFANRVINSAVRMVLRKRAKHQRSPEGRALSLERKWVMVNGQPMPLGAAVTQEDRDRVRKIRRLDPLNQQTLTEALAGLPPKWVELAQRMMYRPPYAAARELGMTRTELQQAMEGLRTHFVKVGLAPF